MLILGIHDGHNAAVALLRDNTILSLLQEERMLNEKNSFCFPSESIKKVLEVNNLKLEEIDYFVFNGYHVPPATESRGSLQSYRDSYSLKSRLKQFLKSTPIYVNYKARLQKQRMEQLLSMGVQESKIKFVEHHTAHASAAYYGANFSAKGDRVLVLTQDGSGDGLSGTVSIGVDGRIERIASIKKEDSLGRIYATTTFMMGMVALEHEYKLMGMAPYAPESGKLLSKRVFSDLLEFDAEAGLTWKRKSGLPPMQMIYPYLRKHTELHRFDWIAAGLQAFTEEMLVAWVRNAIKHTGIKKIALSGGTFMNVKANQYIAELDEVDDIFVFPSCGDETNAIGAAWNLYYSLNPDAPIPGLDHMYHGPDETNDESVLKHIEEFKSSNNMKFSIERFDDVELVVGKMLADGEIVARCKGPLEFGARSLGNRAILCDAGDLRKITEINHMIKKRDFWMPFAPLMLKERSNEYIRNPKNLEAPYMILTFDTTSKYSEFIGGVQQVDLTARPQLVDGTRNPELYKLLKVYEKHSGKGVMINTSFNLHGLPMVYGPKEALFVFANSGLKNLNIGNYLLRKVEP